MGSRRLELVIQKGEVRRVAPARERKRSVVVSAAVVVGPGAF